MDQELRAEIEMLNDRGMWERSELRRDAFGRVKAGIKTGMMVLVTGLRRTGKSFMAQQLLSSEKKPFYFSFDKLAFQKPPVLEEVVKHALSQKAGVIALDEVQKVPQWSGILKGYYDHFKPRPSFLLSGSSSAQLRKGTESLAGRVLEERLPPLSYPEFLRFSGIGKPFRRGYVQEYALSGAFPEVVVKKSDPARYARSIVDKVVGEDIPQLYGVEHPEHLPGLVRMLAERVGSFVDYRDLASSMGISKDTAQRYVFLLEKSFLVDVVRMHGRYGATYAKSKKVYFAHPQLAAAYAPIGMGQAAENLVYMQLKPLGQAGFFRSGRQEIDFIFGRNGRLLPIEVKFRNSVRPSETRTLRAFMEKKNSDGLVITASDEDTIAVGARKLHLVPLFEFLSKPSAYLP